MHQLVPTATIMAVLVNPAYPSAEIQSRGMQAAARTLGVQLHILRASNERDIDDAFATLAQLRAGAFVISSDPFFNSRAEQFAALALRHAVPTIFQYREFAAAGGLMSYGGSIMDSTATPACTPAGFSRAKSRPTCQSSSPRKFELIINLKTAKALGLEVPPTLLARADEVIE